MNYLGSDIYVYNRVNGGILEISKEDILGLLRELPNMEELGVSVNDLNKNIYPLLSECSVADINTYKIKNIRDDVMFSNDKIEIPYI